MKEYVIDTYKEKYMDKISIETNEVLETIFTLFFTERIYGHV